MSDKIFCGSGKVYGQYGQIGISICLDDIHDDFTYTDKAGKRWVRLNVCPKRNAEPGGNTHYIEINQWKPDNQR